MQTLLDSQTKKDLSMNNRLAQHLVQAVIEKGIKEFCVAPGARNAPLIYALTCIPQIKIYYWPEERSAAFFALGRIKATGRPVAVVTTSGTAAAELLPATMEAYYTSLPLLLITADRPKRFRGTGAPQSAEQVGLYSHYVHYMQDLADSDSCRINEWTCEGPAHLNVCFEEPNEEECQKIRYEGSFLVKEFTFQLPSTNQDKWNLLKDFFEATHFPVIVIGALNPLHKETVISFLIHLNAPIYAEGISGLREEPRLSHLHVSMIDHIWQLAAKHDYPIDGVLRIGGIPTARLWRDLEEKKGIVQVCSISEQPFSGLSWATVIHTGLYSFLNWANRLKKRYSPLYHQWLHADRTLQQAFQRLFKEEPLAEQSLIHELSSKIPVGSKVYLGNSLPIREWDQAATKDPRFYQLAANRGVNGIDGQIATFLGYSSSEQDNWAILGDLTALYDLAAPWIFPQLPDRQANVVIVNNGGAQIFARLFAHDAFRNAHQLDFQPLANFWKWHYEKWLSIPDKIEPSQRGRLIELIPDLKATERFLAKAKNLC